MRKANRGNVVDISTGTFSDQTKFDINELISKSYSGLILSPEEGACYASSEYLLFL